jgi:hypothetical protein
MRPTGVSRSMWNDRADMTKLIVAFAVLRTRPIKRRDHDLLTYRLYKLLKLYEELEDEHNECSFNKSNSPAWN